MPKNTKRPQKPKSPEAKRLTQSRRGGKMDRIPSATLYVRPKSGKSFHEEF